MISVEGNTLPEGWKIEKLEKLIDLIQNGISSKQNDEMIGYPVSRIETIQNSIFDKNRIKYVDADNDAFNKYKYDIGDISFSHINSYEKIGKVAIYKGDIDNLLHGVNLLRLKFNNKIYSEFGYYFFKSSLARKEYEPHIKRAINQASINQKNLKSILVPFPPLEEQKRIVAKIDTLFAKIDKAISLTEESLKQAQNLLPSVLKEVFEKGKVDGWEEKKLGDIAFLKSGSTPSRSNNSYWDEGTIPWLKSGELNDVMGIKENSEFISEIALNETSVKLFEKDTLLIAMYGATAGKLGILSIDATTNQAVCSIQNKKRMFNNHFVFYFLFSIREKIIGDSFGGAQPNISKTYLENLTLCLPDLSIQEVTVSLCNELSLKAKQTQSKLEKQLAYLKQLKSSILSKAFQGEL